MFFKSSIVRGRRQLVVLFLLLFCLGGPLLIARAQDIETAEITGNSFWLWDFIGRLHPIAVHFPIGLLLFAAILELFTIKNFQSKWRPGIHLLVGAGTVGAIVSVVMGLLLSRSGDYNIALLSLHQWTGIATAVLSIIAFLLVVRYKKTGRSAFIKAYRTILFFTATGVAVAGHYGGSLTHGSDFLSATIPWSEDYYPAVQSNINFAAFKDDTAKLNASEEAALHMQVKTIFAHSCYKCHGADKVKGDLRLDKKDMFLKGGEHGPVVIAGNPDESELVKRITLPIGDQHAMPSKDKRLSADEINIIKLWIRRGAPWPATDKDILFRVAALQPRNPPLPKAIGGLTNPIDLWVNEYFTRNKIEWPKPVDDKTYFKRIYLDIVGLVPSPEDEQAFVADNRPDKRAQWVTKLLSRNDDYAQHWLTFWNDALRNDYTGTGYITGGRYNISDWLYKSLRDNKPYNQFVQELINPNDSSKGFIEGIRWRGVVNASQKTEMQAAQNVSQVLLGINLKCASCHNSFISNWKLTDAYAFATIFADSALEINRCDKPTGKFIRPAMLWTELGIIDSAAPVAVKRKQLSDNIVKPQNGRLYRTLVNRVWAQMMGRGMVEPVDVMDNVPWSQDLLDWLAFNFTEHKCDIKDLIYLIATSDTYQLPSVSIQDPNKIISQDFVFKGMLRKRMTAEQFSDAVSKIIAPVFGDSLMGYNPYKTGKQTDKKPLFTRASLVINNPFLLALGRPSRENVTTVRETQANLLQALELTKGQKLDDALKRGAMQWLVQYRETDVIIKQLYSRAFSRSPTQKEMELAKKALGNNPDADVVEDLFWAVLLQPEFQLIY